MSQDEEMEMMRLLRKIASAPPTQGCICPPEANLTCQNPLCPRGGAQRIECGPGPATFSPTT